MKICHILFHFYWFVYLSSATNNGSLYKDVACLSKMSETSSVIFATLSECAILSNVDHRKAFSFNNQTGECKGFMEDANVDTTCSSNGAQFYKLQNTENSPCPSLPLPPGYRLEYPYFGSSDRALYTCTTNIDQPPVDHCPVVRCDGPNNFTTTFGSCSVKDLFNRSSSEYEGGVTCTVKGVTCQRWDANYPHKPSYYVGRSDLGNRCRLLSELRPWCYTTDPGERWDHCAVKDLICGAPPTIQTPPNMAEVGIKTEWPAKYSYGLAWYRCTNFSTSDPVSSCPVTICQGNQKWSNANISCSVKDCYNATSHTYQGRVSCTEEGTTCQRWDSDFPHEHTVLKGRSDLHNWCQMGDESTPWCYTTDPYKRWNRCLVDEC